MAVRMVRSCDLNRAPYNTHFSLNRNDILAKTVKDARQIGSESELSYVHVPRCVMFENGKEDNYKTKILGYPEGIERKFDDAEKMKVLAELVGPEAAGSGVVFSGKYREYFTEKVEPQIYELQRVNYQKLEVHFYVSGIVQKCGTSAAFSNIFHMIRLDQNATLSTAHSDDPNRLAVKINGDLFSAALFMGMIAPDFAGKLLGMPRILHGIDTGLAFSPYNSIVYAVNSNPIDLPMGMCMNTMNIDDVSEPVVYGLGPKIQDRIARSFLGISSPIRELANNFISSL